MENNLQGSQDPINFLIGYTRIGKSTLAHGVAGTPLSIQKKGREFNTIAIGHELDEKMIGNTGKSATSTIIKFERLCDLPGLNDTGGDEKRLEILILLYNEIQNIEKFRFILLAEESLITISKSSLFLNFTNEVIDLFNLTPNFARGLHLVITKSSQDFIEDMPDTMIENFPKYENFIIEGIKNKSLKISSFNKPINNGSEFIYYPKNIQEIMENIASNDFIHNNEIKFNILPKIYIAIENIKISQKPHDICFLSENCDNLVKFENILVIDKDIDIYREILEIDGPTIIVASTLDEERYVTIRNDINPIIRFSSKVKTVINGESLVLTTANTKVKHDFLDPCSIDFIKSDSYVSLESILIDDLWNPTLRFKDNFIDLSVYFNQNFGTIDVGNQFKIKKITCDIAMKLSINKLVKSKTKNNISLRDYKDARLYLNECKKSNISKELVDFLENYIVNLPHIFEILMKPSWFKKITNIESEIMTLRKIRKLFIKRYLKFIEVNKILKTSTESESTKKTTTSFLLFMRRLCNFNEISHKNTDLIDRIDEFLICPDNEILTCDFLGIFYDQIIENISELNGFQIISDQSSYPNFEGFIKFLGKREIILENRIMNFLSSGAAISTVTIIKLLHIDILSGFFNEFMNLIVRIFAGLGLLKNCSDFLNNAIQVEGKDVRLDCRFNFISLVRF